MTNKSPLVRVWFQYDIEQMLTSVMIANGDIADAIDTPEMRLYRRGFDAAIAAIAAAIGIDPPQRSSRNTLTGRQP